MHLDKTSRLHRLYVWHMPSIFSYVPNLHLYFLWDLSIAIGLVLKTEISKLWYMFRYYVYREIYRNTVYYHCKKDFAQRWSIIITWFHISWILHQTVLFGFNELFPRKNWANIQNAFYGANQVCPFLQICQFSVRRKNERTKNLQNRNDLIRRLIFCACLL